MCPQTVRCIMLLHLRIIRGVGHSHDDRGLITGCLDDLLVEFNQSATLFDQVDIQEEVRTLLDRPVDVVSKRGLHPYIRARVLTEAVEL